MCTVHSEYCATTRSTLLTKKSIPPNASDLPVPVRRSWPHERSSHVLITRCEWGTGTRCGTSILGEMGIKSYGRQLPQILGLHGVTHKCKHPHHHTTGRLLVTISFLDTFQQQAITNTTKVCAVWFPSFQVNGPTTPRESKEGPSCDSPHCGMWSSRLSTCRNEGGVSTERVPWCWHVGMLHTLCEEEVMEHL